MLYIIIGIISFIVGLFVGKANSDNVQKLGENVEKETNVVVDKIKTEL